MRLGTFRAILPALACALALPAAAAHADLAERLDAVLASRALKGARIGALVTGEDGRTLYAHDPERALVPASNLKILTSIAALATFGPTHRFTTEVYADAPPDPQGAVGVLAIRGAGDPSLTSEEWWRLAAELRRAGVRTVREGVWLDDSAFDRVRWHPSWGAVSARAYHAPVAGLSANYGAYAVALEPGERPGDPVRVQLEPPVAFLRLTNRATTGPASGRASLSVDRGGVDGFERVSVSGVLPAGAEPRLVYRSVRDPVAYAGSVLRLQLEANDIRVGGPVRAGPVPAGAAPLVRFEGKPVSEIVRLVLKYSSNPIAESLVKLMGARASGGPGSWPAGVTAMLGALARVGVDTDGLRLVDGSGLSYENRVSARALVGALRLAADSFAFGPEFVAALPIASADGTLEERADAAAHAVRAKTGLLTRVTALSGFARRSDGETAVFSILVNGYRRSDEEAMDAVDAFVAALVEDPGALAAQELLRRSP